MEAAQVTQLLPAIDLHKNFIDEEGVAKASVFPFQSSGVKSAEFDTPEADRFAADSDASFGQEVFDIPMTQIESVVEPDCVTDDIRWEPVALISIHEPILAISAH